MGIPAKWLLISIAIGAVGVNAPLFGKVYPPMTEAEFRALPERVGSTNANVRNADLCGTYAGYMYGQNEGPVPFKEELRCVDAIAHGRKFPPYQNWIELAETSYAHGQAEAAEDRDVAAANARLNTPGYYDAWGALQDAKAASSHADAVYSTCRLQGKCP